MIHTIDGRLIANRNISAGMTTISLTQKGVYIISLNYKKTKVLFK
ncbi:hypothetical protein M2135_001765 [Parabacteroides sp. PF5-9]|nr:hypothetical protein [Parabacteroides sp. PF5-9]